jgi:serine/threonine-protein kinase
VVSGVTEEFSTTFAKDAVIRTDPPAGATIHRGDGIALVVSKGPQTFPIPSVIGLSKQAAVAQLEGLGLKVDVNQVPGSTGSNVVSQLPAPNVLVTQGATVKIYVA